VQRLRYVRQLGLAHLVYPGATHTRFEHALGTYHLAGRALALLDQDSPLVRAAMLLHDIGHYPFSHALEEIGAPHHEDVARPLVLDGPVAEILRAELGAEAPEELFALIRGRSAHPLQGLVAGPLDLDKIEYLKRDAFMCGVPYGEIDVDRLIHAMVLVDDPPMVGLREKGLAALESLLFAKYQMYRNVYWHHAVRSATAMYKRLVAEALAAGTIDLATLTSLTDEGLLAYLEARAPSPLLRALRTRRLYKRALECPAAQLGDVQSFEWIAADHRAATAAEDELGATFGLGAGELLLDFPAKTRMLELDLPVRRRSGAIQALDDAGWEGAINLPSVSDALYRSARWLRVFVVRPIEINRDAMLAQLADIGQRRHTPLAASTRRS
jgi:HD superfamily phosphohydrolase